MFLVPFPRSQARQKDRRTPRYSCRPRRRGARRHGVWSPPQPPLRPRATTPTSTRSAAAPRQARAAIRRAAPAAVAVAAVAVAVARRVPGAVRKAAAPPARALHVRAGVRLPRVRARRRAAHEPQRPSAGDVCAPAGDFSRAVPRPARPLSAARRKEPAQCYFPLSWI
ncbi:hypothetical protein FGB62_195g019 [Gracilaria domingensis]|nr:hypothetical protein FGB62_195g019 [Gracilaria domingensis]